ncbi:MAG TPA: endonuclease/exonuclease/phosphatase family protein [Methylomirabilota bacterium]
MRVVFWNIRHGGGVRAAALARQIRAWAADAVALCEFRGTPPSGELARALADLGLAYQCTTADGARPALNGLLLAARWPVRRLRLRGAPAEPARWLLARVQTPAPLVIGVMHVPNRVSGRKYPYLDAVLETARRTWPGPALFLGDTNSGCIGVDEQVPAFNRIEDGWMRGLHEAGWTDAFRHLRGETSRAYTWYSPNGGNGFRIDQAFLNAHLRDRLHGFRYHWGRRDRARPGRGASDHAAMVLDLHDPASAPSA